MIASVISIIGITWSALEPIAVVDEDFTNSIHDLCSTLDIYRHTHNGPKDQLAAPATASLSSPTPARW